MINLLDEPPDLDAFIALCAEVPHVNVTDVRSAAEETVHHARLIRAGERPPEEHTALGHLWYRALRTGGQPDFSIYSGDAYLGEAWACWRIYSREHVRGLRKVLNREDPSALRVIVDLGCGPGLTTAALKESFPSAAVYGTNLEGTAQTAVAQLLGARCGFHVKSDVHEIEGRADLVVGLEYFEHFEDPLDHLRTVLHALNPRLFAFANSFNGEAPGHFDTYRVDGVEVPGRKVSVLFGAELRKYGYQGVKTGLWNNRPTLYRAPEPGLMAYIP